MTPQRVQISRKHPWRERHPDAVKVDRTTKWGNPFRVEEHGRERSMALYRAALLAGELPVTVDDARRELAGRDLACWCAPDQQCHADILIEIANPVD